MSGKPFKYFRQLESVDCGPTCLKMICHHFGRDFPLQYLREVTHANRVGVTLDSIQKGAETLGLNTLAVTLPARQLITRDIPLPSIIFWKDEHFVVLVDINTKKNKTTFLVADPGFRIIRLEYSSFMKAWKGKSDEGVLLAFEPTSAFYNQSIDVERQVAEQATFTRKFIGKYTQKFYRQILNLCLVLVLAGGLNLLIPILTQKLVDKGIGYANIDFLYLIVISQIVIFSGIIVLNVLKGWVLLYVNTRISMTLTSDFLLKLFRLPIYYFDSKWAGDLINRIGDNRRIERFLTSNVTGIAFAAINFIAFSFILLYYDYRILLMFLIGSVMSVLWIMFFLKQREMIDYHKFEVRSENTSNLIETISGMPEIKLNGAEDRKRWEWEKIQAKLFEVNQKELHLEQYQYTGSTSITQLKNIIISFFSATLVVEETITLGTMLSISYIVGQMNGPLYQLIDFFQSAQDASISLDRLGEVHLKEDEHDKFENNEVKSCELQPIVGNIAVRNLKFSYSGFSDDLLFNDVSFDIPAGKITAIVGHSGSGKTTLLKLLLGFYPYQAGEINIGGIPIKDINPLRYRSQCGVVLQEGYLFSDSIANNIALSSDTVDMERVIEAANMANIHSFITGSLHKGYHTKIGNTGIGLSKGQQQRILIARAIYKDPTVLMFDEATSALDSYNEKTIQDNLALFFAGRTVVIIAHRLSTVRNADQIIVLEDGMIAEIGSHQVLLSQKGIYYSLVRNQIEMEA